MKSPSRYIYKNLYVETVKTRLLGIIECSEVEKLATGIELLSVTEFMTTRPSKRIISKKTVGGRILSNEKLFRRKFMHADMMITKRLKAKYGIR